jgi:hypothetical protein
VEKLPKVKPNQPFSKLISVSSSEKVAQNFWSLKFFLKKTQSKQLHNGRKFWSPWAIAMTNALMKLQCQQHPTFEAGGGIFKGT